ncbi:MAG: hypothetical protein QW292_09315 [Candidatus Parvarchaeota archaeon]
MDRDEVYREMLRIFRENGYNDFIIVIKTPGNGDFFRYIPFHDIVFSGRDRIILRLSNGKRESFRYKDIVKIESIESLGEGD